MCVLSVAIIWSAIAAYTSPHWPLQVPDEYLDLYAGEYDQGYDRLREENFEALKRAGIVPAASELPPRNDEITQWEDLTADEQRPEARKMELYAAMVENLDLHFARNGPSTSPKSAAGIFKALLLSLSNEFEQNERALATQFAPYERRTESAEPLLRLGPEATDLSTDSLASLWRWVTRGGSYDPSTGVLDALLTWLPGA